MEDTARRIVTQLDPGGKSVFLSDGLPATIAKFSGGFVLAELWTLDAPPTDPGVGSEPTTFALEPPPGGITYRLATIPPDTEVFAQLDTLRAEFGENPPISLDPDEYGMHQTQTIDFVTILSGRCHCGSMTQRCTSKQGTVWCSEGPGMRGAIAVLSPVSSRVCW